MEQTNTSPLLNEIRALVADSPKPIIMIAVPRWAALHLGRERAKELGTKLTAGHADSLRYNPDKPNNNGSCLLWLPIDAHPHGGCFILANTAYEAGLLIAFTDQHSLLWPRTFIENRKPARFGGPLIPWRSDQHIWVNNHLDSEIQSGRLTRAAVAITRKTPLFVHPSPYLVQIITAESQPAGEESPAS